MKTPTPTPQGFTLVELLVVITIIVAVSACSIPVYQGLASAGGVSTGGNIVSGIIDVARGEAIARNRPTAVAMLTTGPNTAYRVLTILAYNPPVAPGTTGSWSQISKWHSLPKGVVADSGTDDSGNQTTPFLPPNSPVPVTPAVSLPVLTYMGTAYKPNADYGYFIIQENGSLFHDTKGNPPSPCKLRVSPGFIDAANALIFTGRKDAQGKPMNYYDIIVNDATGRTKIVRP